MIMINNSLFTTLATGFSPIYKQQHGEDDEKQRRPKHAMNYVINVELLDPDDVTGSVGVIQAGVGAADYTIGI